MLCSHEQRINFHECRNLQTIVAHRNFNCRSKNPRYLSAVSPSSDVLFLVRASLAGREVKQIDCKHRRLCFTKATTPIYLTEDSICDMHCIQGGRRLLFLTEDGLVACSTKTGKKVWSIPLNQPDLNEEMTIRGITTDAEGHFFVCDTSNECVHVFSDNNGEHLGVLLKKEDGVIGVPHRIGWNHKSGLLIVTHKQDDSRFMVSIYKLRK